MDKKKIIKLLKKGQPFSITIIFAIICSIIWLVFSDFILNSITHNTKLIHILGIYRYWFVYLISVIVVFLLVRYHFKKAQITDKELKKTEDSYYILLENLREEYFFYRHSKDMVFENITPSIKNILGYSPDHFRENYKKYKADKMVGDYIERHNKMFNSGIKQPPIVIEVLDSDNKKRVLEVKEIPIFDEDMEIVAVEGIVRDITEFRRLETELNDQKKRFTLLYESSNDAILILKGEKIIDCNQAALHIFNCSIDQIIMQVPFSYKFSPPVQDDGRSSLDKGREYMMQALKGEAVRFDWTHIRLNGEKFYAESYLKPYQYNNEGYIQLLIKDVSDLKLKEEQNQYSEEHFKGIYENSIVGFFRASIENGMITSCNNAAAKILGYENKQDLVNAHFIINSFNSITEKTVSLLNIIENRKVLYDYQVEYTLNNGLIKYLSLCVDINKKDNCLEGSMLDITDRKTAELEIIKNEKKFREVLDNSRILLYKLNAETGDYQYLSPAVKHILGYNQDEILSMDVSEIKSLLHPDDLGKAQDIIAKLVKEIPGNKTEYTAEYRMKNKYGNYRWLSDSYKIIKDKDGKIISVFGNVIDITVQKETQEALRESELRFRKMADNIQNGVTINENGKNIYVNDRLCEITGYTKEELMSFNDFQIAAPEEKKRIKNILDNLKKSGDKLEEIEFWILKKDRTRACVLCRYSYNYINNDIVIKYIITSDITERKYMEKALVESEEKFLMLADMLPQTVFEAKLNGDLTYSNQRGIKQFGYTKEDIDNGLSIYDVIIPEQKDLLRSNFEKLIEEKIAEPFEYTAIRKNGHTFPITVYSNVIKDNEGNPIGVRGIILDTSNQKRVQEELKLAKEAAEAAKKAKSIFLTNISHELRTPMNSIFGMTEIIKKTQLTDKQYDFLKVISESSETLLSFLNDIIIIPQIESHKVALDKVAFTLQDIMASSVGLISYQAELKNIKIKEVPKFDENTVLISDPTKLNQILINISEMLIKYCEGENIKFIIEQIETQTKNVIVDFNIICSCVKIPEELLQSTIGDFNLIHPEIYNKYGSQGLGFLVANQLIEIFNSKLDIVLEKDLKLKFRINFEKGTQKDLELLMPKHELVDKLNNKYLKNISILVVEDEIFNQLVIQTLMEDWDCEIDMVENGKEAIEKYKKKHYDVILMDIVMPEMDGIETTKYIREEMPEDKKHIPIIGITAYSYSDKINEFNENGIDYIICKPFKSDDLFHILVKCLYKKDIGKKEKTVDKLGAKRSDGKANKYDLKIIENIAKNNKVLIVKMINVFIKKTKEEIKLLKKYTKDNDINGIRNVLHKMLPALSYIGCDTVRADIEYIQEKVRKGVTVDELQPLFSGVLGALEDIIKSLKKEINKYM